MQKNIGLGEVAGYLFGAFFLIIGIVGLFPPTVFGLTILLISAIIFPPFVKLLDNKFKIKLSRSFKVVLIILLITIGGAFGRGSKEEETTLSEQREENPVSTLVTSVPTPQQEVKVKTTSEIKTPPITVIKTAPTPTLTPVSSETVSQKNAVKKAKSYLGYTAFSHDGLAAQLEYEQFSHADAVYGADNSDANWNEQASKKAKSYMEYSAFSRGSLIEQLKHEKFTQAQAEYGANAVGL